MCEWTAFDEPSRSDAGVCSLSDILETPGSVPPRYYLSARACAGILRRAVKRGKTLPGDLLRALRAVADVLPEAGQKTAVVSHRHWARLQGFPDGYTAVSYRGKPAADGLRYKALGNSMAVNVMRWIGRRIQMVEAIR